MSFLIEVFVLGHSSPILCASFSPTGNLLATGSGDTNARLWDLNTETLSLAIKTGFYVWNGKRWNGNWQVEDMTVRSIAGFFPPQKIWLTLIVGQIMGSQNRETYW